MEDQEKMTQSANVIIASFPRIVESKNNIRSPNPAFSEFVLLNAILSPRKHQYTRHYRQADYAKLLEDTTTLPVDTIPELDHWNIQNIRNIVEHNMDHVLWSTATILNRITNQHRPKTDTYHVYPFFKPIIALVKSKKVPLRYNIINILPKLLNEFYYAIEYEIKNIVKKRRITNITKIEHFLYRMVNSVEYESVFLQPPLNT